MRPQRLLALATLALTAACAGNIDSPVAPQSESPASPAAITNPYFNVTVSPASATFLTALENTLPTGTQKIVFRSQYAAFGTLGPPRIVRIDFLNGQGGWVAGTVSLKSAMQADLDLRALRGLPVGVYRANVILTLAGVVNFTIPVTFVSGRYFFDDANSSTGWTFTGLWHVAAGNNCQNFRGCTPLPSEGSGFFWYGSEATGNFNFGQNSGSAQSPAFVLPTGAQNPTITVRTWFEIEYDVSPCSFDRMEFWLDEVGGGSSVFVGRINSLCTSGAPFFNGNSFAASGGPWVTFSIPIPSDNGGAPVYGKNYRLQLFFNTGDGLYNNYRGWGVDEILIAEAGASSSSVVSARVRSGASTQAGQTFVLPRGPAYLPLVPRK